MSDEATYTMIIVSGCPVAISFNKSFYIEDATSTGHDRLWRSSASQRICWKEGMGWSLVELNSDGNNTPVTYYYSGTDTEYTDPWDVETWKTTIEEYKANNPLLVCSTDPEIETTTETIVTPALTTTQDEKFQVAKKYYNKTDVTGFEYVEVSQIIVGREIPEDTYFQKDSEGNYYLTEDASFKSNHVYYTRVDTGIILTPYIYTKAVWSGDTIPTSPAYYESTGVETQVITTTYNKRTKETTRSVERTVSIDNQRLVEYKRYVNPTVEAGKVYRFSFVEDFKQLGYIKPSSSDFEVDVAANDSDITRGVYRIEQVTTYYDLVLGGVDVYQNLYMPCSIPKKRYEQDKNNWMNGDVWYKLVDPTIPANVLYVPTSIIEGVPDGNVTEYNRYHLLIDIGVFNEPEILSEMVTCINMLFKAKFGIPTTAQLATYDTVFLPSSYYDWMDSQRQANINEFMETGSTQYFNTLFKIEYNKLEKENAALRTQVKTYEELVNQMAN